jgi:FdhE protein
MSSLRERAGQLGKKWPGYAAILDFYVAVREAQDASRPAIRASRATVGGHGKGGPTEPGHPLLDKENFPVDLEASIDLFRTLCKLGKGANQHLSAQVDRIEAALVAGTLDLNKLLAGGGRDSAIEQAAVDQGLDARILSFLVRSSTRPSIDAVRQQLCGDILVDGWDRSDCPVCGSAPMLSLLKGQRGLRHSLCSRCGCEWKVDRVSCCVCGNKDAGSLQYFHSEGDTACRIDLCDKCRHYIKTIDCRSLEASDPYLEDLATLHLDVVATQKGYTSAVPNFWSI